jgi:hypothetical protein
MKKKPCTKAILKLLKHESKLLNLAQKRVTKKSYLDTTGLSELVKALTQSSA